MILTTQSSPAYFTRPKFLICFPTENHLEIESLLEFAWSKNFLDVTAVTENSQNIYYLNPFKNELKKEVFQKEVKIFPEKLNINGNKITLWS